MSGIRELTTLMLCEMQRSQDNSFKHKTNDKNLLTLKTLLAQVGPI
jgi:hypothetical protein